MSKVGKRNLLSTVLAGALGLALSLLVGFAVSELGRTAEPRLSVPAGEATSLDRSTAARRRPHPERPARLAPTTAEIGPRPAPLVGKSEVHAAMSRAHQLHEAETRDPTWAARTDNLLREDFGRLAAQVGFELTGIDCRTTLCTVSARWRTQAQAVEHYRRMLWMPTRANCERGVVVPDGDLLEPIETKMILNCKSWRESGAIVSEELPALPAL